MSVIGPSDTEIEPASQAMALRYKKVDSIESKRSVVANEGTPASEQQQREIDFMGYIQQVALFILASPDGFETYQVAKPEGQLNKIIYNDKFSDDNLIKKKSTHTPSMVEVSFMNNYISKILQSIVIDFDAIERSIHHEAEHIKETKPTYEKFRTFSDMFEIAPLRINLDELFYTQVGMELRDRFNRYNDTEMAKSIAKTLKARLEESPALEAAIAFSDPVLFEQLSLEELAELEISGIDDFRLFIVTEAEGRYFALIRDFIQVLELAQNHGWFPSIEVFTEKQAKEAGGVQKIASNWSPRVHTIFDRKSMAI